MDSHKENSVIETDDREASLEESIEILTTDDERLKIIGEELSNDTGRAVITKLVEGVNTISAIAQSLDISIRIVSWHIQRLSKAGLITIKDIKLSSRNKEVMCYAPTKLALVIVPAAVTKSNVYTKVLKSALMKVYKQLPALMTFIGSSISLYIAQKATESPTLTLEDPDRNMRVFFISSDLLVSLIGGAGIAFIVWLFIKFWNQSKS